MSATPGNGARTRREALGVAERELVAVKGKDEARAIRDALIDSKLATILDGQIWQRRLIVGGILAAVVTGLMNHIVPIARIIGGP